MVIDPTCPLITGNLDDNGNHTGIDPKCPLITGWFALQQEFDNH